MKNRIRQDIRIDYAPEKKDDLIRTLWEVRRRGKLLGWQITTTYLSGYIYKYATYYPCWGTSYRNYYYFADLMFIGARRKKAIKKWEKAQHILIFNKVNNWFKGTNYEKMDKE